MREMNLRLRLLKKPLRITGLTILVASLCSMGISSIQDVSEYQKLLDKISDQIGQLRAKIKGEKKKGNDHPFQAGHDWL